MKISISPSWIVISVGIFLNIVAIIMSSFVLDKLNARIEMLNTEIAENNNFIQINWDTVKMLEAKREFIFLHLHLSNVVPISRKISDALRYELSAWSGKDVPEIRVENLSELLSIIDLAQRNHKNKIDDYYYINMGLGGNLLSLKEKISYYKVIAIFFQVFGLAFIFLKDVCKK